MASNLVLCICDCGCGRVTNAINPVCAKCLDGIHPTNPFLPPKGAETARCADCDGFVFFDKKAKMFKCGPFCQRSRLCD